MNYPFGSKKFKKRYLILLLCIITTNYVLAAQQPLNAVPKSTASNAITVIRDGINTELAKQQTMNTELYSLSVSGLPPCSNAGDIREWDGDSWECTPIIDFSATSPLSFNSTTGVLSLTPWTSQSAFETAMGWTISGSGGGITVSSTLPTTAGAAALNDSTHVLTVASDTGYTSFTGSFTAWDITPEAFGFGTITDAVAGQEYCWTTPATVAGINKATSVASTASSYKINGTTSTATSIALGDTLIPCMVASNTAGATVSGNMTIGGVAGDPAFSVTTVAESYVVNELFTTGVIPSSSGGLTWTDNGDGANRPSYNYATSPAPIEGSYSVKWGDNATRWTVNWAGVAAMPDVYVAFVFNTPGSGMPLLRIGDGAGHYASISATTTEWTVTPYGGSQQYGYSGRMVSGVSIYVKIRYTVATNTITIWSSPTGAAGTWTATGATATGAGIGNLTYASTVGVYSQIAILDRLRVSASDINY